MFGYFDVKLEFGPSGAGPGGPGMGGAGSSGGGGGGGGFGGGIGAPGSDVGVGGGGRAGNSGGSSSGGGGFGGGTNPGRPGGESGMRGSPSVGGGGVRGMDGSFGTSTGGLVSGSGSSDTIAGSSRARNNFAVSTRSQINANNPQSFRDARAMTQANGFFENDMGLTVDLSGGVMAPNDPGDRANYSEPGFRNSVERSVDGSTSFTAYADSVMNPDKYAKSPQGVLGTISSIGKSLVDNAPSIIGGLVAGPPGAIAGSALDAAVDAQSVQSKLNAFRGGPEVSYGDALGQIGGERAASAIGRAVVGPIAGEVTGNVMSGFTNDPVNQMVGSFVGSQVGGNLAGSMAAQEVAESGPLGSQTLAQNARYAFANNATPAIASPATPSMSAPQGVALSDINTSSPATTAPALSGMSAPQGVNLADLGNTSSATTAPASPSMQTPTGTDLADLGSTSSASAASPGNASSEGSFFGSLSDLFSSPSSSNQGLLGFNSQGGPNITPESSGSNLPSAPTASAPAPVSRPAPASTGVGEFTDYSSYASRVFSRV